VNLTKIGDEHRRALGLGLSGAHRTGKTTVAEEIARVNECPIIRSSVSSIAKEMGLRADLGLPTRDRIAFQDEVLRRHEAFYEAEAGNGLFVADRTPLDFAAYALTDWQIGADPKSDDWLSEYVRRCMDATSRWFFLVSVVQPGIRYEVRDDKPAPNNLYQEFLNTVLIGLAADHTVKSHFYLMPRGMLKNGERAEAAASVYEDKISSYHGYLKDTLPHV